MPTARQEFRYEVMTYMMRASNGKLIRKATKVVDMKTGLVVAFTELLSKGEAIRLAELHFTREAARGRTGL